MCSAWSLQYKPFYSQLKPLGKGESSFLIHVDTTAWFLRKTDLPTTYLELTRDTKKPRQNKTSRNLQPISPLKILSHLP